MLAARFNVCSTILTLLAFVSFTTTDPHCEQTYGQPTYTDCLHVVDLLQKPSTGHVQERRQLFFSLHGEEPPSWIPHTARVFRASLPIFLQQGESSLIHFGKF